MKNILKIFLSLVIMLSLIAVPVYAAEPQMSQSTLTYTVDDSFFVMVPETIPVGETAYIYPGEINIAPEKQVHVILETPSGANYTDIQNVNDPSQTVSIYFTDSSGKDLTSNTLGTFTSSMDSPITFLTRASVGQETVAGDYSGVVYFSMFCE